MAGKPAIKSLVRRYGRALDFESHAYWRERPIVPDTVVYESFAGNGMLCNPRAIFEALLADPAYRRLKHIWVLDSDEAIRAARSSWPKNVQFVRKESRAYYRALATSQYLVNNATFPNQFSKRSGQIYLNTWHGTPLKKMGYDMPGGGSSSRNVLRNFVMADYLVSSSPFMTEQMYLTGYKLRGIYRGSILESGLPRIDVQLEDEARARARRTLEKAGVQVGDRRVILYAPTWRGSFYRPSDETTQLLETVATLQREVGTDHLVLLKTHQVAYQAAVRSGLGRGVIVPNDIPTNEVLAATDTLVTDYSSIFFDALPTRTPLAFYMPDGQEYDSTRGLYEAPQDLPGPVASSLAELAAAVRELVESGLDGLDPQRAAAYDRFVEQYVPHEDGGATQRVIENVFGGRASGTVHDGLDDDGRTSLLVYVGGLRSNGITTSMLSMLSALDPTKYDVSAFYGPPGSADERKNEKLLPESVRVFPRVGGYNGSKRHRAARRSLFNGLHESHHEVNPEQIRPYFRDEWHRCFGEAEFDHVIDFSGYGPMWPNILLAAPSGRKSIWLHNDVVADSQREVDGKRPLEQGLRAVFSTYRYFDSIVSVSSTLAAINREKLADHARPEQFTHARNLLDGERVLRLSGREADLGPDRALRPGEEFGKDLATDLSLLEDLYGPERIQELTARRESVSRAFEGTGPRFITMGRLSPEKNHARLINAFAQVVVEHPDAQLAILGTGPLEGELRALVGLHGLAGNVHLTGFQSNPYAALAASDCFVLSSDYEGQPMVILEARTLGVPVITTSFGSAAGALQDDEGLVVARDTDALAGGMLRFLEQGIPHKPFDVGEYNLEALDEFLAAISWTGQGSPVAAPVDAMTSSS
ncbi:hypothetical protein GCM10009718_30760 [Isoptericola halotolerans]|uniref:CDP-glycerol glycerophosphotransferase (TagB/SpsB family)/glycosyltransferase involved in cell wall biosynthesis n=1 Tax=Isoptericola halotolerans TaxID=300560 RepID=A0ABX2A3Z2_9MICO|nr:glycosyltransferase [Isoptericola halotolerans]NOV97585.1 CDP-glycerol glycerophosphotransferase (TagB/SpsB family)/glycosyltransferase involved in cell wall biosynthesis [Isoptericola halotolerans]